MDHRELYKLHAVESGEPPPANVAADPRHTRIAQWVAHELSPRESPAPQLVELGFGDAGLARALVSELSDARYLGLDIAELRVKQASEAAASAGLAERLRFRILDLENQLGELPDGLADALFAIDVMEHVFDVFGFVDHAARITKPGGLLILRVPNIAYIRHRVALARGSLPVTSSWFGPPNDLQAWRRTWGWDGGHLHYFTLPTMRALLSGAGFSAVAWRDPGARFEVLRRIAPGALIGNLCVLARRTGERRT